MDYLSENFKRFLLSTTAMLLGSVLFFGGVAPVLANDVVFGLSDGSEPEIGLLKEKSSIKGKKGKYIDISLSKQTLTLYKDGKPAGSYVISSGKKSMATPKGNFKIYNKAKRAWSDEYGLYMPYWMAFTPSGSHGIHELPEWPSGYKEGAGHLGIPVSHGCVRLGVGAAKKVYDWAPIGTPVIIH